MSHGNIPPINIGSNLNLASVVKKLENDPGNPKGTTWTEKSIEGTHDTLVVGKNANNPDAPELTYRLGANGEIKGALVRQGAHSAWIDNSTGTPKYEVADHGYDYHQAKQGTMGAGFSPDASHELLAALTSISEQEGGSNKVGHGTEQYTDGKGEVPGSKPLPSVGSNKVGHGTEQYTDGKGEVPGSKPLPSVG